jgi:hypothetical protein
MNWVFKSQKKAFFIVVFLDIKTHSSYLTGNISRLRYRDQQVNGK